MKIYLGADHGGYQQKEEVKNFLTDLNPDLEIIDCGAASLDPKDDYPNYAFALAEKMSQDPLLKEEKALGLLFCRSGSGMVIAANKVKGIRAVELYSEKIAEHAKSDNRANVLAFGSDYLSFKEVIKILKTFLATEYDSAERHLRRIEKINKYELDKEF